MEGQSSLRKQAKFSQRILCCSQRILRSLMPNEHPDRANVMSPNLSEQMVRNRVEWYMCCRLNLISGQND